MTKAKKRPSKKAKEAMKVLEKLKNLENAKTTNSLSAEQISGLNNSVIKNNVAHKPRPNKKRG